MGYEQFFNFAYSNIILYLSISFSILFFLFRKFCLGGVFDPFHITFTFTFSTSYSVIILLWIGGYDAGDLSFIILAYGLIFIIGLFILTQLNPKFTSISNLFHSFFNCDSRVAIYLLVFIYIALTVLVILNKGFSLFTDANRFEDNRGIGPLIKCWEYSSLFLVAYFSIKTSLIKKAIKRRFLFFFVAFLCVFNSIISGAKSDLLFYLLACFYAVSIYYGHIFYRGKHIAFVFLLAVISIFVVLYFNFHDSLGNGGLISILRELGRRFMDRIFSNGDMYYLGIPNGVIDDIKVKNVIFVFLSSLIGVSILSSFLGYNISDFDIGRQILKYHYPTYDIAGGPTDHFDLFAYKYFGVYGVFFVIILSFYIYLMRTIIKRPNLTPYISAVYTVLWFNIISVLLKPGMVFSSLLLPMMFFIFFSLIDNLCTSKR